MVVIDEAPVSLGAATQRSICAAAAEELWLERRLAQWFRCWSAVSSNRRWFCQVLARHGHPAVHLHVSLDDFT